MNRPRILQCITRLGLGGAEAMTFTLIEALRHEWSFGVFAVRGVEHSDIGRHLRARLQEWNVPLFCGPRIPFKAGGMAASGLAMFAALRRFQPAAVHLHTEIPEAACATMVTLTRRRPNVVIRTIHSSMYWHVWRRLGRWMERQLADAHVACVSEDARSTYLRFREGTGAGPPFAPPKLIYNGAKQPPPRTTRLADRQPDTINVVVAGRFEYEKGTDLLPEILAHARVPDGVRAHLVLQGRGPHLPILRGLAAKPPAGWSIELRPPVADFSQRIGDFDLLLVPSRFEGLALVAVEAALAGVPVVATDAMGLREALPPDHPWRGRAGNAADIGSVLTRALRERDRWGEVAQRSRAFAEARFGVDRMARHYAELYACALR